MVRVDYFELNTMGLMGKGYDGLRNRNWEETLSYELVAEWYGYSKEELKFSPNRCIEILEDFVTNTIELG